MFKILKFFKNLGFRELPIINGVQYIYRKDGYRNYPHFQMEIAEIEDKDDDIYVYGWIIQYQYIDKNSTKSLWFNHWNHKLYSSKEIALDAINQFGSVSWEFRVLPLYNFKNTSYRNYIIDKIIKD